MSVGAAPVARRPATHRRAVVVPAAAVVALASLVLPSSLSFDTWAWLVWGREVAGGSLDTTGGVAWKPLPVLLTTALAPLGDLAVPAYLVVARTASLLLLVGVAATAARHGGRVAGAVAGAALVLTPDGEPRLLRLVLEGHEAPWSAGLALLALVAHLEGRRRRASLALWALSLLRPEAWPFLVVHLLWWARGGGAAGPRPGRWWAVGVLASVPLLWFVADWVGSGHALQGARTAQVLADDPVLARLAAALCVLVGVVPLPLWPAAAVGVARRWRDGAGWPLVAGLAAAWSGVVVGMAVIGGYAAISRFFLPVAAVVCVLAGLGVADVVRGWPRSPPRRVVAGLLAAGALVLLAPRVVGVAAVVDEVAGRGRLEADLDEVIARAGGRAALARCADVAVTGSTLLRSSVAWKLHVPLHAVHRRLDGRAGTVFATSGPAAAETLALPGAVPLARTGRWLAAAVDCPRAVQRPERLSFG